MNPSFLGQSDGNFNTYGDHPMVGSLDRREQTSNGVYISPSIVGVYVVDASVGVKWFLDEENSDLAERLLREAHEGYRRLMAPPLFWYEVANALRYSPESDADLFSDLEALLTYPVECVDPPFGSMPALGVLARKSKLTFYDAAYVSLSVERGVPLLTEDHKVATACVGLTAVLSLRQLFGSVLMEAAAPYLLRQEMR